MAIARSQQAELHVTQQSGGYGVVPNTIRRAFGKTIGIAGLGMYAILAGYAGAGRTCWPSLDTIAEEMGCDRRTVETRIKQLIDCGLIAVQERPGRSNLYLLLDVPTHQATEQAPTKNGGAKNAGGTNFAPDPPQKMQGPPPAKNEGGRLTVEDSQGEDSQTGGRDQVPDKRPGAPTTPETLPPDDEAFMPGIPTELPTLLLTREGRDRSPLLSLAWRWCRQRGDWLCDPVDTRWDVLAPLAQALEAYVGLSPGIPLEQVLEDLLVTGRGRIPYQGARYKFAVMTNKLGDEITYLRRQQAKTGGNHGHHTRSTHTTAGTVSTARAERLRRLG